MYRNTGGVNLRETRVGEAGAFFIGFPGRTTVGVHGVGGQEVNVTVAARTEQYGVGRITFYGTVGQVAANDTAGVTVLDHDVHHLATGVELDAALVDFVAQRAVGPDEQLLAGLAAGIERTRYLRAAERTVVEVAGVVARKRHALRHALVYNGVADLSQTVNVGLAGAVVAALDRIVKQTVNAVAVVLVILGRIDTALGRDGVRAARRIRDAEYLDIEPHGTQSGRRRSPGQTGAHDDDVQLAFVGRIHQMLFRFVPRPFLRNGTGRHF